jgi:diguanylate cyclase (GGDEF)-like protein
MSLASEKAKPVDVVRDEPELPPPAPISKSTAALMVYLYQSMFERPAAFRPPRFDINKLSTSLYGMGFERDFLRKCEYQHYWNFASLFPALEDGSFFQNSPSGRSHGQAYLRGFATLACGTSADAPWHRTELNDTFEQSLLKDGYKFSGRTLVETSIDTAFPANFAILPGKIDLLGDLSAAMQGGEPVGVLFLDLDHFKRVNDQINHAEGDKCLKEFVHAIAPVLLNKGKLYRIGGDEFCVMLPNFAAQEASATAERIRKLVDGFPPFGGIVKVTSSIGVADSETSELDTPEGLVSAADEAMYVAKFTGGNRVCLWPPQPAEAEAAAENRKKPRRD